MLQGLWDRLVGRMCARLAWKKIGLMLNWLNGQLSFSDGVEGRANWVSGRVRDENNKGKYLSDTYSKYVNTVLLPDCLIHHLIVLC